MIGSQHSSAPTVAPRWTPTVAPATVPDQVLAQARRTPEAVAVESGGHRLTYAQLTSEATGIARRLSTTGVGPGDRVAVALPRSVDLVAALLGVQFAGAAYVPLDPDHPVDRLNYILTDSGVGTLVTADAAGAAGLRVDGHVHLTDIAPGPGPAGGVALDPDSAAYVIYTSGSTGRPKGVMVSHGAFATFIRSMRERPGVPDDVVLPAVTTVSFDIAGLELFLPLTTGGRVVVAQRSDATDPRRLAALLIDIGARVMQATPITWRLLLDAGWSPPPGFTVLCGGERLPADLADRLMGDGVVLWDLYGPTETTVWSAVTRHERGSPPVFHPVLGTSLHLVDERLRTVSPGTVGEVYIGGAGVAVGYLGRAALTADRFVADPFTSMPGSRMYRTGDLARALPDGRIDIIGRSDHQIKIRGFRIEPGEVEHLLTDHAAVAEAAVRTFGDHDATRLVAYVRPADPANPPDARPLQLHLARTAPAYMIPAQFVVLDAFPRTPNGKLDRAGLPRPPEPVAPEDATADTARPSQDMAGSSLVQRIAKTVAEVLDRTEIGPHEDFFSLGGDSLRAVQIILRLNEELETEVPINALFETRTVYGLAALLDQERAPELKPRRRAGEQVARLSAAQWRLWLHMRSAPDSTVDNMPIVVGLPGPFDPVALASALTGLLDRHPILRTRYELDGSGLPVPVVAPPPPVSLAVEDNDPHDVLAEELARPFDLAAGPPIRFRVVRRAADDRTRLLVVVHRIAADDRSGELIGADVRAAYRGRTVPGPALDQSDYVEWQRELATSPTARRHLDFWRTTLAGLATADLPVDRPRQPTRDRRAGTVRFAVSPTAAQALREVTTGRDASPFMGLLAEFCAALAAWTGGTDVAVGVPVAGRDRPELENVVGMLEEVAVIRTDLGDRPAFPDLLTRIREATLAAVEHAVLPLEDVVAAVAETSGSEPTPGRNPLFDAFFAVHPIPADPTDFPLPDAPGTRYDVCCRLTERPDGGLDGRVEYATDLFDEPTVARLARDYVRLLTEAGTP